MGYRTDHPESPEGKRVPGRTPEERASDYEMAIPSTMDEALTFYVVLPKKKIEQHIPDEVPAEPPEHG